MGHPEATSGVVTLLCFVSAFGKWCVSHYQYLEFEDSEHWLEDKGREGNRNLYTYCQRNFTKFRTYKDAMAVASMFKDGKFIDRYLFHNGKYGPTHRIFISEDDGITYYPVHCVSSEPLRDAIVGSIKQGNRITYPRPTPSFSVFDGDDDDE